MQNACHSVSPKPIRSALDQKVFYLFTRGPKGRCMMRMTLPVSGGLFISMVCMAMMSSPTKHATYRRT